MTCISTEHGMIHRPPCRNGNLCGRTPAREKKLKRELKVTAAKRQLEYMILAAEKLSPAMKRKLATVLGVEEIAAMLHGLLDRLGDKK